MTNELLLLSILTISIVGVLILLLLYLTIRKALAIKKRRMIETYKEEFHHILFKMITDSDYTGTITSDTPVKQKAIEELLNKYTKVLEGEEEKRYLAEIAEATLGGVYRKQLKDRRWSIRLNTLHHIEDFMMTQLQGDVLAMTENLHLSYEEQVHVLRILASFQFELILELLTDRFDNLSEIEYRNILFRLHQHQFDQFVLHFHKSNPSLQKAILEVISLKRETVYLSFLENIFQTYDGEIRIRVLKALSNIGYVKTIDPYIELLYSSKWEERMIAAKLIGTLREEKGIPRLVELLQDSSWWVRSQAGQAISYFANGKEILTEVLKTSSDPFARDMAWEWLHKGGMNNG